LSNEKPQGSPKEKHGWTASETAELTEAAAKAAAERLAAAKAAAEAAVKEYEVAAEAAVKAAAEAEKEYEVAVEAAAEASVSFTDNRRQERIFRREMGEPEFFHTKKDLIPTRPILTESEQEEISRLVEIPMDQVPPYKPKHILSPEFGGRSNYESGVTELIAETTQKLNRLRNDPDALAEDIIRAEQDLKYLDSLYQNFYFGMNVFRTAKGGRDKIRE
jgi:colicin import membrane protein